MALHNILIELACCRFSFQTDLGKHPKCQEEEEEEAPHLHRANKEDLLQRLTWHRRKPLVFVAVRMELRD